MSKGSLSLDVKSIFARFREEDKKVEIKKVETKKNINSQCCSYCKEDTLVVDEGSFVCTKCGRESGIVISEKQEWRTFSNSNDTVDKSRCGMPSNPLLPQSSLGTVAQGSFRYGFGRLQIQNAMPSHERSRLDAFKLIKKAAKELKIQGVLTDMTCYLYVKITENIKVKRGPVRRALMANCQYSICKRKNTSTYVCPENLSKSYNISVKKFNEGSKLFAELSFYKTNKTGKSWNSKLTKSRLSFVKPTEPENIIRNVCEKMSFKDIDIANIIYIARNIKKFGIISSKMPQSIAAGCILLYVKEKKIKIKMSNISNFCTVSDTTAKNTYNDIKKYKKILISSNIDNLKKGNVGCCMPEKHLSKIYTAPKRAMPPTIIIKSGSNKVNVIRGRPKKTIVDDTN